MNIVVDYIEDEEESNKLIFEHSLMNNYFSFDAYENNETDLLKQFYELFDQLETSVSDELLEQAWKEYSQVSQQMLLEGQTKSWMICAFYTTIWQFNQSNVHQIFSYSVLKLLIKNGLSVMEFLTKLNRWAEMIMASRFLLCHVSRVQSSLAVSTVIYKKLLSVFRRVFLNISEQNLVLKLLDTSISVNFNEITSCQIFELIWIMFIVFKKQFENVEDDLINSFQLLLCIMELIFEDLREAKLTHLYNSDFEKSLETEGNGKSVLEYLCETFNGSVLDAKHFRLHCFFPKLRILADDRILIGNADQGGILANIKTNKNTLDKIYEVNILRTSMIDERIFLISAIDSIDNICDKASEENAINVLREYTLDSRNELMNAEFALRILTQNCLEQLNEERFNQGLPITESHAFKATLLNQDNHYSVKDNHYSVNRQFLNGSLILKDNEKLSNNISKVKKGESTSKRFDETIKLGRFEIKKKLKMVL